jgi:hypothetical protein
MSPEGTSNSPKDALNTEDGGLAGKESLTRRTTTQEIYLKRSQLYQPQFPPSFHQSTLLANVNHCYPSYNPVSTDRISVFATLHNPIKLGTFLSVPPVGSVRVESPLLTLIFCPSSSHLASINRITLTSTELEH